MLPDLERKLQRISINDQALLDPWPDFVPPIRLLWVKFS